MWAEETEAQHGAEALLASLEAGSHVAKANDVDDHRYSDALLMVGVVVWFCEVNTVHASSSPVDTAVSKRLVGQAMNFFQSCEVHADEVKALLKSVATISLREGYSDAPPQ